MKILASVFTSQKNKEYFDVCREHYEKSKEKTLRRSGLVIDLQIIDFSQFDIGKFGDEIAGAMYVRRPGKGFCHNFNLARNTAIQGKYDFLIYMNDDVAIHEDFIKNSLSFLEQNKGVGFSGGTSQLGGWKEDLQFLEIPEPKEEYTPLDDIRRLHWEFSSCMIPVPVLDKIGEMDNLYSPLLGLCCDNDYLLRIRLLNYSTVRNGMATFWHSKARTQSEFRNPLSKDVHRERAVRYLKLKWGNDIRELNGPKVIHPVFKTPFNGRKVEIIDQDNIIISGKAYNLWED